ETHVLRKGEDPAAVARKAEADALGMAGGDGSLAAVAGVAMERGLPFVCVPFGTRNHFARDVGLDRDDPLAALAGFDDRVERAIDVGRANERLFLNNVSLGVYARLVHRREHHRRRPRPRKSSRRPSGSKRKRTCAALRSRSPRSGTEEGRPPPLGARRFAPVAPPGGGTLAALRGGGARPARVGDVTAPHRAVL